MINKKTGRRRNDRKSAGDSDKELNVVIAYQRLSTCKRNIAMLIMSNYWGSELKNGFTQVIDVFDGENLRLTCAGSKVYQRGRHRDVSLENSELLPLCAII